MFDDLSELENIDLSDIKKDDKPSYGNNSYNDNRGNSNNGNYQGNNNNNGYNSNSNGNGYSGGGNRNNNSGYDGDRNGGSYNRGGNGGGYNRNGGGNNNWKRKEEVVEEPYIPVTVYVNRDFPQEAKDKLYSMASRLINKNITVRFNGDDKDFYDHLSRLSDKHTEVFIPWRNFNDIESKHYYNTLTAKHIASSNFGMGWEKIPDGVKAMLARDVRMVFGDKNNSPSLCVITWSQDGANKVSEVNKETGRASFIIKMASSFGFPVLNLGKNNAENVLEKSFNL